MKLAFNGEGRFADFGPAYELYLKRDRGDSPVDESTYRRILKAYCRLLADKLEEEGMIDLPCDLGMIAAASIRKRAIYRKGKFVGYGAYDYKRGCYDGKLKAFGLVYLAKHEKGNLRSYGFVANRQLFKRMKEKSQGYDCPWKPIEFNDELI